MVKKLAKDVVGLVGVNLGLGIGGAVVGAAGGSTAGIGAAAGMMPVVSTVVIGKHLIRKTAKIDLKYKMPKRRR